MDPDINSEQALQMLASSDPGEQSRGVKAMIRLVETGDQPWSFLLNATNHKYWRVRLDAIEFIVKRNPPDALRMLHAFRTVSYHVSQQRIREYIDARYENGHLLDDELDMAKDILDGLMHAPKLTEVSLSKDKKLLDKLNGKAPAASAATNTLNARDIYAGTVVVGSQILQPTGVRPDDGAVREASNHALQIYALLQQKFSLDELKVLSFQAGVNWDELSGDTQPTKAMALVQHCERRGRLPDLVAAIRRDHPDSRDQT